MDANLFLIKRTEGDTDREDLQYLESLELAASSLLQQGRPEKALDYMEQALQLRRNFYGENSTEAVGYCRAVARKIVVTAVQMMEKSEMLAPLQMLQRVELLVSQFPSGKLVTESCEIYNNLACAYRKHNKLPQAKQYILKALKLASVYKDATIDRAATHLNMCAILSNQGQHAAALEYGLKAVQYAQEDLVNINLSKKGDPSHKITVLAVAYHNAGVEEEHLSHYENALDWYQKALRFVEQHGDDQHRSVLKEFEKTYKSALKTLAKKMNEGYIYVGKAGKKRPKSAYKPERRVRRMSPKDSDEESQESNSGFRKMGHTTSQNRIRNSRYIPKKPSTSPMHHGTDFNTRDPLEGKPSTFEEMRKHRFRPLSPRSRPQISADPSVDSGPAVVKMQSKVTRKPTTDTKAAESDEDLRELEAMGLLDYSLETTRRENVKRNPVKKLRGKRRKGGSPRAGGRNSDMEEQQREAGHLPKVRETPGRSKAEELALSRSGTPKLSSDTAPSKLPEVFRLPMEDLTRSNPTASVLYSGRLSSSRPTSTRQPPSLNQSSEQPSMPKPRPPCPPNSDKSKEVEAAMKIQAGIRRFLAGKKAQLIAKSTQNRKLLLRSGKRLKDGSIRIISIYKSPLSGYLITVSLPPDSIIELQREIDTETTPPEAILAEIDVSDTGKVVFSSQSALNRSIPSVPNPAIVKIQANIRGALARKRYKAIKRSKSKRNRPLFRCAKEINGRYYQLQLISDPDRGLYVLIGADLEGISVPTALASLPYMEIVAKLGQHDGEFAFSPPIKPSATPAVTPTPIFIAIPPTTAPPPLPETPSPVQSLSSIESNFDQPHDEEKITLIQSVFRMRQERKKYQQLQQRDKKNRERLVAREMGLLGERYLVTVARVKGSKVEIEVEAYPLSQVSIRPRKSIYDENRLREAFNWPISDPIPSHEAELLSSIRLENNYAVIYQLSPSFQAKTTQYQTYRVLPDGHLYEISFKVANETVEITVKLDIESSPVAGSLQQSESDLKSLANVSQVWGPKHFEFISTRLTLENGVLGLINGEKRLSIAVPMINVSVTPTENDLTTDNYVRDGPVAKRYNESQKETAAVTIQSHIRRFLARKVLKIDRKSVKRREMYRCFQLFPGKKPFSVQFFQTLNGITITAIDLTVFSEFSVDLVEGMDYNPQLGIDFRDVSQCLWPKKNGLGVFLMDRMNRGHNLAAISIQKVVKGRIVRKLYPKLKEEAGRCLDLCRLKTFSDGKAGIAIYLVGNLMQIEVFPVVKEDRGKKKAHFAVFSMRELTNLYTEVMDMGRIYEDVLYENEQISLMARIQQLEARQQAYNADGVKTRAIIRTSRRLDERMWVVTMSVVGRMENVKGLKDDDIIEFTAFSGGQQLPLKLATTIESLSRLTHLPSSEIYPMGNLSIHRLLKVHGSTLYLDSSEPIPDTNSMATLIQSHIRGFVARRKLVRRVGRSQLITCVTLPLDGTPWVLYAYREPPFVKLEAVHRIRKTVLSTLVSDRIFTRFPSTLSKKRIIDNFIFPKLQLVTESGTRHLRVTKSMQLQQTLMEKHQGKIQVITSQVSRVEAGPLAAVGIKAVLEEDFPAKSSTNNPSGSEDSSSLLHQEFSERHTLSVVDASQSPEFGGSGSVSEARKPPAHTEVVSSAFSPGRKSGEEEKKESSPGSEVQEAFSIPSPASHPHTDRDLIVRTGLDLSSHYFIISIFGDDHLLFLELTDPETHEKAGKELDLTGIEVPDLNLYCGELLNRVRVRSGRGGRMEIEIGEEESAGKNVLYKKSHYLSNRYCVVTFFETKAGIVISAYDPEKRKTLELKLGHRSPLPSEQLQREISSLAKRLRIQEVLGEETLILSFT